MIRKQCLGFLNTPPLWEKSQFGLVQFDFPTLNIDHIKPKAIPHNIRLGHQLEFVFKQLVEASKAYDILLHNLPIKNDHRTIGEIDFVLKDKLTKQLLHIELTYKFYIINPEITAPIHRLMGPNKRDRFFTKMEKIRNVQIPLLHSTEGKKALEQLEIDVDDIEHQTCFKGQLFKPFQSTNAFIGPLNNNCIEGYWLRFAEFNTKDFQKHQYYIPTKSEWVITPHSNLEWKTHFEIAMEIQLRLIEENAPMVWMKKSESIIEKFFVVWW